MGAPKCRLDVWNPVIAGVATNKWVTCENPENNNAVISVFFLDKLANPRRAEIVVSNRAKNYTSTSLFDYHYRDSEGNNVFNNPGVELREYKGVLTDLFRDFMHIRLVDLETNVVVFAGRLVDIDVNYNANTGTSIKLKAYDALDELRRISPRGLSKDITFYQYDEIDIDPDTHLGHSVTDIVKAMIALGYKKEYYNLGEVKSITGYAAGSENVKTDLLVADTLYYPDSTVNQYRANIVTDDSGTALKNRFQTDATPVPATTKINLTKIGSKGLLGVILENLIHKAQDSESDDNDGFGWDYFVDANISYGAHADFRGKNLDPATKPPPAMFNVWERGKRIYNIEPATYGLSVKYPSSLSVTTQGARNTYVGGSATHQNATKPMSVVFDFDHPKEGLYTGVLLKYNDKDEKKDEDGEKSKKGGEGKEVEVKMDIIYGQILGDFAWRTVTGSGTTAVVTPLDISGDDLAPETSGTAGRPGLHSAEYLDLHSGTSPYAKIADNVARVQYQSNDASGSNYDYILISHVQPELLNVAAGTYRLYGVGDGEGYNGSNAMMTVNLGATVANQGYPRRVWGIEKIHTLSKGEITEPNKLRLEVASILSRSSIDIVNGSFEMSGKPQYFWDGEIRSVANATVGQTITVQDLGQTSGNGAAVDITRYGFREGMVIAKMTGTFGAIATAELNGDGVYKDVYGYCWDIPSDTSYNVDLHQTVQFAVGDRVRFFIPLRAGDTIRVENVLADVAGNHLVTEIEYTEEPNQNTKLKTTGVNEGFGLIGSRFQAQLAGAREESDVRMNLPKGHQPAIWTGLFSAVDANTVQWQTVGGKAEVALSDGSIYNVDCATANDNNTTHASGTDGEGTRFGIINAAHPVAGGVDKTVYFIYLDPNKENLAPTAKYHFYTRPSTTPTNGSDPVYDQDGDNIIVGWMRAASSTTGLAEFGVYRDSQPGGGKSDLANVSHAGSATSALLKKGAQTFTTDLMIEASGSTVGDMWREVKWHGGETGNDTTNASLVLADGTNRVVAYGGDSGNDNNGSYTLGTASGGVGSTVSYSTITQFSTNTTYYAYVDFAEQPTGDLILRWTTTSHVAYGDDRILLAMIVIPPNSAKGNSPVIIPLTTKSLSINAVAIAANSITADHVRADTIDTSHLLLGTGGGGAIAGITSGGNINLSYADNTLSLDKTVETNTKKHVNDSQREGGGRAYTGFNAGARIKQDVVFSSANGEENKSMWFYPSNSNELLLINHAGLAGYSGCSGSYPNINVGTTQFEIRTTDGMAHFGGGACVLNSAGLFLQGNTGGVPNNASGKLLFRGSTASATDFTTNGDDSDGRYMITNHAGTLYLFVGGQSANTKAFGPTQDNVIKLGTTTFGWSGLYLGESGNADPKLLANNAGVLEWNGTPIASGSVDQTADYDWTGEHKFDRDGVGGNAATPGLMLKSRGTPSVPPSGYGGLFVDQANGTYNLYFRTPNGTVPIVQGNSVGGSGEANEDSFRTIAVSGQSNIIADSDVDTLTFAAGSGITIETNASTDTVTITATGGGGGGSHDDPIRLSSNSSSSPTYSFSASTGSGMYWDSGVAFSNGGNTQLIIKNTEAEFHNDARPAASTSYFLGDQNTKRWRRLYAQLATDVSSDAELKENKKSITNGLEFISNLNPITFNRIESTDIEFGFTAQDMKQAVLASGYTEDMDVYSESVDDETGKTYWGIAYESLVAPLVAAIKELKDRIEVLENA